MTLPCTAASLSVERAREQSSLPNRSETDLRLNVYETAGCRQAGYNHPMPTVMQIGPYRFLFFSNETQEPAHIHIKASGNEAKFWLEPVRLATNHGFRARELNEIERLVAANQSQFVEAWNDYFSE